MNVTYADGATYREVSARGLSKDGVTATSYQLLSRVHTDLECAPVHGGFRTPAALAITSGSSTNADLLSGFWCGTKAEYPSVTTEDQERYRMAQDSAGNSYISSNLTTNDPAQSYQAQKKTEQTVDN